MNEGQTHIPTEVYLDFLGRTIEIHWNYHAVLMFSIWFVMVPICIMTIRFFKPRPSEFGITTKIKLTNIRWWWFNVHKYGLFLAIGLSLAGLAVALVVSRGFSGSVHSIFGITTITLGCLQVITALFRGTHGGRYYNNADPDDPATWHGDHFDMTFRRRLFEAYHKNAGYLAGFFAIGAVASGLMQYHMPVLTGIALVTALVLFAAWAVFEFKGMKYDGYRAVFGLNPEHPHNKARKDL
ncbi:MAG TPA: cytochrome b561 domain-containing protein [Afifellaceae bacterium]|nr:cytochrome b561 domain-containing protein [Afifellaceae bacterium]